MKLADLSRTYKLDTALVHAIEKLVARIPETSGAGVQDCPFDGARTIVRSLEFPPGGGSSVCLEPCFNIVGQSPRSPTFLLDIKRHDEKVIRSQRIFEDSQYGTPVQDGPCFESCTFAFPRTHEVSKVSKATVRTLLTRCCSGKRASRERSRFHG